MVRSVTTFDVFDTLIARRSVDPGRIVHQLELRAEINGLTSIRLQADRDLGSLRRPYQLREIWQVVQQSLGLDAATADRLMKLEIEIEHEESIPIAENLALVRDGDVLVSDTYLPAEVVRSLLHQAGLRREVALVISNDGKFTGRIWPELLQHFSIQQHLGDNPHSDGRMPSAAGIPAVIYTGAARTPLEQLLVSSGWQPLADFVREARLANPFPPSQPTPRHLWLLTCQLNFPLLLLASLRLEQHAHASGAGGLVLNLVSGGGRGYYPVSFPYGDSTHGCDPQNPGRATHAGHGHPSFDRR